jgi:hypothetical protein
MGLNTIGKKYNFKWYDVKTVSAGGNSFTTSYNIVTGSKLRICDTKYGVEWSNPTHYTVSGNVITFTESSFVESLTFQIWCFV